jgi:hypothetical protein
MFFRANHRIGGVLAGLSLQRKKLRRRHPQLTNLNHARVGRAQRLFDPEHR